MKNISFVLIYKHLSYIYLFGIMDIKNELYGRYHHYVYFHTTSVEINLSITFHYYPTYVIILYEQRNLNNKKFIFCRNEYRFKYISKRFKRRRL